MNSTRGHTQKKSRPDPVLRGYLNGVLDLASFCSEWIGRSETAVFIYAPEDFPKAFQKTFRIHAPLAPVESPETFSEALTQWLGCAEQKLPDKVAALFEHKLGPAQRVLRVENEDALLRDLSASERGFGAFYFTEGAFFVEFPEHVLAFLLGNFE